jgi:glutamine synthetase
LPSPWNFDGSSTKQATGDNSEVFLKPVKVVTDPFKGAPHVLVMCETYQDLDLKIPNKTNLRYFAKKIFDARLEEDPWFGIEQE